MAFMTFEDNGMGAPTRMEMNHRFSALLEVHVCVRTEGGGIPSG